MTVKQDNARTEEAVRRQAAEKAAKHKRAEPKPAPAHVSAGKAEASMTCPKCEGKKELRGYEVGVWPHAPNSATVIVCENCDDNGQVPAEPHLELYVIFDGPPGHDAPRFIEVEDAQGQSHGVDVGVAWNSPEVSGHNYWRLGPFCTKSHAAEEFPVKRNATM